MASIATIIIVFLFIMAIVAFVFGEISFFVLVVSSIMLLLAAIITVRYLGW